MTIEELEYLKEGHCIKLLPTKSEEKVREFVIINMDNYNDIILLEITSSNINKEIHVPLDRFEADNVVFNGNISINNNIYMKKYVVYYRSKPYNSIKEFISLRFAVHFKESMDDYYKLIIKEKEIKENALIYDDECSIIKSFNTLEDAKEYKLKHNNPSYWTII